MRCRIWRIGVATTLLLAAHPGHGDDPGVVSRVVASIDSGQFEAAEALISGALAGTPPDASKHEALHFQRERMRRIQIDFSLDADGAPPKQHFRSDTVDSQRGEVEWDGGNLYFNQWKYGFDAELAPPQLPKEAS